MRFSSSLEYLGKALLKNFLLQVDISEYDTQFPCFINFPSAPIGHFMALFFIVLSGILDLLMSDHYH